MVLMMACAEVGAGTDATPTRGGTESPPTALCAGETAITVPTDRAMAALMTAQRWTFEGEAVNSGIGDIGGPYSGALPPWE